MLASALPEKWYGWSGLYSHHRHLIPYGTLLNLAAGAFWLMRLTAAGKTTIAPALLMQLRTNTKMAVTCWDGDMDVTERKYLSREDIVHGAQKFIPVFNHVAFLRNRQPISPPIKKHPSPKGRTSFSTASS